MNASAEGAIRAQFTCHRRLRHLPVLERLLDITVYVWHIHLAMVVLDDLRGCTGFHWDESNAVKNWEKHGVSSSECEQVFFNHPLVAGDDREHSQHEPRYYVLGQTDNGRRLFLAVTIRGELIRVISARAMSRKEQKQYEES